MSVAVLIPYHPAPARDPLCWLVLDYYQHAHPDWPVTVARNLERPFSKAKAVNDAVRSLPPDVDVLVLNDADSICPPEQVREAVRLATEAPGLVFAFSFYHRLGKRETERAGSWQDVLDGTPEWTMMGSGSHGCVAVQRDCFTAVGGLCEAFTGWGYEDLEFNARIETLWPSRRVDGHLFHLFHGDRRSDDSPLSESEDTVRANLALFHAVSS